MTRQEQIQKASEPYGEYFIYGAKWADANPAEIPNHRNCVAKYVYERQESMLAIAEVAIADARYQRNQHIANGILDLALIKIEKMKIGNPY